MSHVLGEPPAPLPCKRAPSTRAAAPVVANGQACGLPDEAFRYLHELTSVKKQLCSPVHIKPRYQLLSKGMFTLQGHTLMYVTWCRRVVAGRPTVVAAVVAAVLAAAVTRPRAHRVLHAAATGAPHRYLSAVMSRPATRKLCCVPASRMIRAHSPCASTAATSPDCAREWTSCWQPTTSSNQSVSHTCNALAHAGALVCPVPGLTLCAMRRAVVGEPARGVEAN